MTEIAERLERGEGSPRSKRCRAAELRSLFNVRGFAGT
jgi:hypothetical protein